jgi:hypothetical protein
LPQSQINEQAATIPAFTALVNVLGYHCLIMCDYFGVLSRRRRDYAATSPPPSRGVHPSFCLHPKQGTLEASEQRG